MRITVLYFSAARERAGRSREELELPDGADVATLLRRLCELHTGLDRLLPHVRVAVDQEFITGDAEPLRHGAEVALIPPVAGGSGLFRLDEKPLRLEEVVEAVSGSGQGGLVTFSGVVRGQTAGRKVLRLEYEAYPGMAEKKLAQIGAEASEQWPGAQLAIVHRTGVLLPGEVAVVIAASAPHRREAFRACEHAIERLKQDVPIWKKEHFEDGEVWVGLGP